jgi:hypothetical protein
MRECTLFFVYVAFRQCRREPFSGKVSWFDIGFVHLDNQSNASIPFDNRIDATKTIQWPTSIRGKKRNSQMAFSSVIDDLVVCRDIRAM